MTTKGNALAGGMAQGANDTAHTPNSSEIAVEKQRIIDIDDLLPPDIAAKPEAYQRAWLDYLFTLSEPERRAFLDAYRDSQRQKQVIQGPAQARCLDLTAPPRPHEFIVDRTIPVANGVLVAPGGVGKTTITIWEAIHIVLGRDVWGHKVLRPGGVLFLTAEDRREDFMYRLYMLMAMMPLSQEERRQVTQNIFIEDVTHSITRLAELDRAGNIVMSPHIDEICRQYEKEGLAVMNIDPLSHFGPGERFVNDAEAAMCQVARRLSDELKAHVRLIHHTGKAVDRQRIIDQYAGRNGSSLADNSRLVMQLVAGTNEKSEKYLPVPREAVPLLKSGSLPLQMYFHKDSYDVTPEYPVWLMRRDWTIKEFNGEPASEDAIRRDELQKILDYLATKLAQGLYCSLRKLEEDCKGVGVTKARIKVLVNEALQQRKLVELELPQDKKQGGFTHYLAPVEQEN